MPSFSPELRRIIVILRRKGKRVKEICNLLEVSAYTVWLWCTRAFHRGYESFEGMPKLPHSVKRKITAPIGNAIIALRTAFSWGTGRIRQALLSPPPYLTEFLARFGFETPIGLSRQAINNVLKKHRMNGSPYGKTHEWKFFRASKANEMWQLDLKGPVFLYGRRIFILVVVDDFSSCFLLLKLYEKDPSTEDIIAGLQDAFRKYGKPQKILTDNGGQFKDRWKDSLPKAVEAVFAHPYYPQDKGKVERGIRNVNEEYLRLVKWFSAPLDKMVEILGQYRNWYNRSRYHQGVRGFPASIYEKSIRASA